MYQYQQRQLRSTLVSASARDCPMMHVRVATTQTDLVPIPQPLKFVFWERDFKTNCVVLTGSAYGDSVIKPFLHDQLCVVFMSTSSCPIEIFYLSE